MNNLKQVYNLRLSVNPDIGKVINELYSNYSISENKLFMQMAVGNGTKTIEENREKIIETIIDMEYRLRLLKEYLYNCSMIDDDININ